MKTWTSFREGFVGSFVLAGAIVMAIVGAAAAFINARTDANNHRETSVRY